MKEVVEVEEMLADLEEAAKLDGTECGEWWAALVAMDNAINYGATERFRKAWAAEVKAEYKRLKRDFRIEETTREVTQTVRRLEFIR